MMRPLTGADTAPVCKRPNYHMFEKSSVLAFFPTFVWVYDLKPEDAEPLSAAIAEKIEIALPPAKQLSEAIPCNQERTFTSFPSFSR